VPTDPEVFAVTEYAFWWGTLLGVVSLLWREDGSTRLVVRCLLVLVGGLSSPLIVPMTALFAIRAAWLRKRSDVVVLAVASVVSVIQLGVMHFAAASVAGKSAAINFKALVARMLGEFVFWSRHSGSEDKPFLLGIVITATLVVFVVTRKKWRDPGFVLVAGCYAIAVTASLARMPILSIHPALGGPRYFFFPYIFLSWMLVFAMGEGRKWIRGPAAFLLACSAIQFIRVGQRDQMDLLWSEQIEQCKSAQEDYALPVHYDGTEHHWYATLNSEDCQSMSDRSLLD
jgi:hypothetical protein